MIKLLIGVIFVGFYLSCPLSAQDVIVKIDPTQIHLNPSETCTLDICIENSPNLGAFEFFIEYNSDIVHADTALIGDFLGSTGRTLFPVPWPADNNSNPGCIRYGSATLNPAGAPRGPSGSGVMAQVVFTAQNTGHTDLELTKVELQDDTDNSNSVPVDEIRNGRITVNSGTGGNWASLSSGTTECLRYVHAVSRQNVWIFGSRCILKTTDGGETWDNYAENMDTLFFLGGCAVDELIAFASGYRSGWNKCVLYRTDDGGQSWSPVYDEHGQWTSFVVMTDENNGYFYGDAIGDTWLVRKTTDGGLNWQTCETAPSSHEENEYGNFSSYFHDKHNFLCFCSHAGWLYQSTDLGETWSSVPVLDTPPLNTVASNSVETIIVATQDGRIAHSSDNGDNWSEIPMPAEGWVYRLNYFDKNFYALIGNTIYSSPDGNSWNLETICSKGNLRSIDYIKTDNGFYAWAVGDSGAILKLNSAETFVNFDQAKMTPANTILSPNYPNPFNAGTTISYSLKGQTHVKLIIYNASGQIVNFLVDTMQEAGLHTTTWDASGYPSGIYFIELETEQIRNVQKCLLLK